MKKSALLLGAHILFQVKHSLTHENISKRFLICIQKMDDAGFDETDVDVLSPVELENTVSPG